MADLLIRGMTLPKSDDEKIIIYSDGTAINFDFGEGRKHKESKAVELPDHGDLIDRAEFESYVQNQWEQNEISNGDWIQFREWLKDQQTIIPASKEGVA